MRKQSPIDESSEYAYTEVLNGGGLEKTARETHIPDKLASAIQDIQSVEHPDHVFMYDRALGAGEIYGPNNNGDFFSKEACQDRHDTFVKHGHLFRHHQNKDADNSIGEIVKSAYNYPVDAVDLITKAPISKVADDLEKIEEGQVLNTSMGARVKYDVCSICGNKAKSRMEYCKHLRNSMGKIFPDGRQVFAKNPKPKFVDLSIVVVPADPTSGMLAKVASQQKWGEIEKESPLSPAGMHPGEGDGRLHPGSIKALLQTLHTGEALKTADYALDRPLSPDEFQAILRKDASLIQPDVIPCVHHAKTPQKDLKGLPHTKIASMIKMADRVPLKENAESTSADFLDGREKEAYLTYRRGDQTRAFLR